ncbi:MAG: hypothetical protein A2156_10225 [Deltaproteobacteria bacterium RBG_16_48_10]|nr:MAG: hypothetical protein A2156_10225 [Deltaproteobacteria bacterium RBG_16_48_10]
MKGEVLEENDPYYIEVEEKEEDEEHLETAAPPLKERAISTQHAFLMTHLLEGVVQHGTGERAKALGRPIAGKTGTSSDYADAWFIGYSPSLLAAVWVGFDDKTSLGKNETGARAALPIWISFMESALRERPLEPFRVPDGITLVKVNLESGLVVDGDSKDTILEAFVNGNIPSPVEKVSPKKGETPSIAPTRSILPETRVDGP